MSFSTTNPAVAELVKSFSEAAPDDLDAEYGRLVRALWKDGTLTDRALPAVPGLVARLETVGEDRKARLIVLLGLLAEAEYPITDGAVTTAVRQGLDLYLALLRRSEGGQPLALAVLYLLSHLPGDRDRIREAVAGMALPAEDVTRLDRALEELDPDHPDLGRVWPAPSVWALDESEREFDQRWITDLSPEQVIANWENDTRTVLGYSGAKAYWAACNGAPKAVSDALADHDVAIAAPTGPRLDLFRRHAGAFRCPGCGGGLDFGEADVRCAACSLVYPVANGILDLTASASDTGAEASDQVTADLLQKLAEMPSMGRYYEAVLRPAFLRMAGGNWGGAVAPSDEDRYIAEHIHPVDGPVLDLAAGAGRWTATVARTVGTDRLIALDMGLPMLTVTRSRLPEVPAVLASALSLPFGDSTLGAVNCWNALQAFPEEAATAIAEVGRCLRPGGTFTMMTFRFDDDPIARYFQAAHHFPSRPEGMLLFELAEIRQWLASAGMTVRDESGPGSFVFVTAERRHS
jgi:SAM-dependent methyltransferase